MDFYDYFEQEAKIYCKENGLNYDEWRNSEAIYDFVSLIENQYYQTGQ